MANGQNYRIENLDVYRKAVALGTQLYQSAGNGSGNGNSAVGVRVRETALAMVLNLAAGLGFWEKEWKASHFTASKRAVIELAPLLELMVALKELPADREVRYTAELQDLAKMIGGLLRQAKRREGEEPGGRGPGGEAHERQPAACN